MKVLLVEDEEALRESLKMAMEDVGFSVEAAKNGDEAAKLFNQSKFDLMITDIIMPFKEGLETIIEAKKANQNMKIIAISGGGRAKLYDLLDLAHKMGADEILRKPFRIPALMQKIGQVLG